LWVSLSRLYLIRDDLVSRRYCRYIFGSIGFVHRSLGLVVATIGTDQSGAAEQGYDTQYQSETKDSLHIGLLLCVSCPSGFWTCLRNYPTSPVLSSAKALASHCSPGGTTLFTAHAPAATCPSQS